MQFLTFIDLLQNELRNARIQNLGSAPSTPVAGQLYYNSGTNLFQYWNGTNWIDPLARTNHTGTQAAATISDLASVVKAYRLDEFAAPTNPVAMGSQRITGLADPTAAQDAVTKNYADALKTGLDFKDSVRAATTANIALSAPQTIDGVAVIAGDRVLVKNQTTATQNGIFQVNAGSWTRTLDADSSAEVTGGMYVYVNEGTVNGDSAWVLSTNDPIVLATTNLVFTKFSGGGQLVEGAGIDITGNTVSVDPDLTQFQFVGGLLTLATLFQTRKVAANIGDGSAVAYVVTHNLNTRDLTVSVAASATPWAVAICDVEFTTVNTLTLRFTAAPTTNQYRVTIVG